MTMIKTKAVEKYEFTNRDRLFLDANIWAYIYFPRNPNDRWTAVYSRMLDRILRAKSRIYVDVLIISEFINTYARTKWRLNDSDTKKFREFKEFRDSADFKPVAMEIADNVKRIIKHCKLLESGFKRLDISAVLDDYAAGTSDFNDQVIGELCRVNELTLITNDRDFRGRNAPILTANPKLLSRGK